MDNSTIWDTQEPSAALWFEETCYIADAVGLVAYGIHAISFFACVHYLIKTAKTQRQNLKWIVFITVLFICGTANIYTNVRFHQLAWINKRAYPGGPFAYLVTQGGPNPLTLSGDSFTVVINFLADGLLLYRVYVLYNRWWLLVIPLLSWMGASIIGVLAVVQLAKPDSFTLSLNAEAFLTPYFSICLALNILLSSLLIGRLFHMRTQVIKTLGVHHARDYRNIATMLLESAAVYGIVSLVFLIFYAMKSTSSNLFAAVYYQVACLSPMLIILRVNRNRTWSEKRTVNSTKIRFGSTPRSKPESSQERSDTISIEIAHSFPNHSSSNMFDSEPVDGSRGVDRVSRFILVRIPRLVDMG